MTVILMTVMLALIRGLGIFSSVPLAALNLASTSLGDQQKLALILRKMKQRSKNVSIRPKILCGHEQGNTKVQCNGQDYV